MNRREMVKASAILVTTGIASSLIAKESQELTPIEERLSGNIRFSVLKEGEYGYINDHIFMPSIDNLLYFPLNPHSYPHVYSAPQKQSGWCVESEIFFHDGHYYVKPSKSYMDRVPSFYLNDGWLARPALLAMHRAYPMTVQTPNGFYIIPNTWKECAKHPLVRENVLALKEAVEMANIIKTKHGLNIGFGAQWAENDACKETLSVV